MIPTIRYDDSYIGMIPVLPPDKRWLVEGHPKGVQVFATEEEARVYARSGLPKDLPKRLYKAWVKFMDPTHGKHNYPRWKDLGVHGKRHWIAVAEAVTQVAWDL